MAKVMVSIPDDLLSDIDSEARRRGLSRSGLLQKAARAEIGLGTGKTSDVVERMEALAGTWDGPLDAAALVRRDRMRNE